MADNTTLAPGVGGDTIRDKDRSGVKTSIVGLDLTPAGGSETLMNGSIPVTDNSGSLTVDAPVATPVFVRLSDGTTAIATLPVSLASLPTLAAGTNNIGDVDVLTAPGTAADGAVGQPSVVYVLGGYDGTNVQSLVTDSTGRLHVAAINSALPAGTNNIGDVDVLTLPSASSATVAQVSSSATSVTLQASNSSRKGLTIFNDSTAILYVKFGTTASATSYTVKMAAGAYWEMQNGVVYTGRVDGIWASANGNAYMTEL